MAKNLKPKILLIEDDTDQIFLYQSKFEIEGFELISCRTGKEGLEMAKTKDPDIILLDLVLIAENGIDVLAKLKNDPAAKHIPVIILTNLVQEEARKKAASMGAADFLIKTEVMPSDVARRAKEIIKA
jgi:DNA-binding response OmpR family regulator